LLYSYGLILILILIGLVVGYIVHNWLLLFFIIISCSVFFVCGSMMEKTYTHIA